MNDKRINIAYYILCTFTIICVIYSIFYKSEQYYTLLFVLCLLNQALIPLYIKNKIQSNNI